MKLNRGALAKAGAALNGIEAKLIREPYGTPRRRALNRAWRRRYHEGVKLLVAAIRKGHDVDVLATIVGRV